MKKLDTIALQELKTQLEELPTRQTLRPYDVIAQLADTISGVRNRGYDIDDLVAVLNNAGIALARNTVRNYLSKARNARGDVGPNVAKPSQARVAVAPFQTSTEERPLNEPPSTAGLASTSAGSARTDRLAIARERAQALREARARETSPRLPGTFDLIADDPDL